MRPILGMIALMFPVLASAEGPVYRLDALRGDSLAVPPPWRSGSLFENPESFSGPSRLWLDRMDRAGFPFAQVWTRPMEASSAGDTLAFEARFLPGPSGPLGELRILGGDRLGEAFLSKLLRLPRREPFSLEAARKGRARLAATGWFSELNEPVLAWDAAAGKVGVLYRLREKPRPNRLGLLLGGGSGQRFGMADLALFSPFGGGRSWSFSGNWRNGNRSEITLDLREPRILGQAIDLGLRFFRSLQDSTWLRQSFDLELEMPLASGWAGRVVWGFERSLLGLEEREISRRRQGLGLRWRGLSPGRTGERKLGLDMDLLRRKDGNQEEQQWELSGEGLWSQPMRGSLKLRLKGQGHWLRSDRPLSEAELYGLGGAASLRGWDEEQFRGDAVGSASLELALGRALELAAFLDYGRGRLRREDGIERFSGWGYGLGIRGPGERGDLVLDFALGEGHSVADLRVHLKLETGF